MTTNVNAGITGEARPFWMQFGDPFWTPDFSLYGVSEQLTVNVDCSIELIRDAAAAAR